MIIAKEENSAEFAIYHHIQRALVEQIIVNNTFTAKNKETMKTAFLV